MSAERVLDEAQKLVAMLRERSFAALTDGDVIATLDIIGSARQAIDAVAVAASAELDVRGIAAGMSYRTAVDAVADRTGAPVDDARAWCAVGAVTAPRVSMSGEVLPPECSSIAAGIAAGTLGVADALIIVRTLQQVVPFTDLSTREEVERSLVERAAGLSRREVAILARRIIAHIDPDGEEPREDLLRARSGLRVHRTPDGLVRWSITMHPEAAGFLTTALDARTAPRREPRFLADDEPQPEDPRPLAHRRLDALVDLARESLQHDPGTLAGTPVTMNVTISLGELLSGIGSAEIAGVDEPVSAATARRLAADAELIPVVLGGPSEPLELGRASRLFSSGQRRAMAVRDGGCVWPGCNAPPGWCEAAHLRSWLDGGPTDLANGVLLCAFHHRLLDHDGWHLEWRDEVLWLIPPAHVDASRAPRRAGRIPVGV